MNPWIECLICITAGLATGVVSALAGVGGGILMVPVFTLALGLEQKQAVATSLVAIIVTALGASAKNTGHDLINWRIAIVTGLSAAIVAWFAAGWLKRLSNTTLTRGFALFVIVVGIHMLWTSWRK